MKLETEPSTSGSMICSDDITNVSDADYVQVENDELVVVQDPFADDSNDLVGYEDVLEDDDFILIASETIVCADGECKADKKKRSDTVTDYRKPKSDKGILPRPEPSLVVSSAVLLQKRRKKSKSAIAPSTLVANRMTEILNSSKLNNRSLSSVIFFALLIVTGSTFWWFHSLSTKKTHHHRHPLEPSVEIKAVNDHGYMSRKNGTSALSKGAKSYEKKNDSLTKARREEVFEEKYDSVVMPSTKYLMNSPHVSRTARRHRRRRRRVSMSSNGDILNREKVGDLAKLDSLTYSNKSNVEKDEGGSHFLETSDTKRNLRRNDDSVVLTDAGLVTFLAFQNFGEFFVGETKEPNSRILMVFYQPSDQFDQEVAPFVNEIAMQGSKIQNEKVGVVNCKQYPRICRDHFIDKFPTIRWYRQEQNAQKSSADDMKFWYDEVKFRIAKESFAKG